MLIDQPRAATKLEQNATELKHVDVLLDSELQRKFAIPNPVSWINWRAADPRWSLKFAAAQSYVRPTAISPAEQQKRHALLRAQCAEGPRDFDFRLEGASLRELQGSTTLDLRQRWDTRKVAPSMEGVGRHPRKNGNVERVTKKAGFDGIVSMLVRLDQRALCSRCRVAGLIAKQELLLLH